MLSNILADQLRGPYFGICDTYSEKFKLYITFQNNILNISEMSPTLIFRFITENIDNNSISLIPIISLIVSAFQARVMQHNSYIELLTLLIPLIRKGISEQQLFEIISSSRCLLVFFFENDLLSLDFLKKEIPKFDFRYLLFFPEIKNNKPELFTSMMIYVYYSRFVKNIEASMSIEDFQNYRRIGHDSSEIAQIIRNDDLTEFQQIFSQNNMSFEHVLDKSLFESDKLLSTPPNLIEYSAFFSSINIFKFLYLLLSQVEEYEPKKIYSLYLFAIAGGSFEIIHLVENLNLDTNLIDKQAMKYSIYYHQNDLCEYLHSNFDLKYDIETLLMCINYNNYQMIEQLLCQDSFKTLLSDESITGLKPSVLLIIVLSALQSGNLLLFNFFLTYCQSFINSIIASNSIFHSIYQLVETILFMKFFHNILMEHSFIVPLIIIELML